MRTGLAVVVFALLSVVAFKSIPANRLLAQGEMTGRQLSVNGLRLARPNEMKSFPTDLLPVP